MTDSSRLDGQVAIVTGAGQGIGQGIAKVLAGAGAKIVIGDLQDSATTVGQITDAGGQAVSMNMDTSNPDDAKNLVQFAIDSYGQLDVLVNNAAIDAPAARRATASDSGDAYVSGSSRTRRPAVAAMVAT